MLVVSGCRFGGGGRRVCVWVGGGVGGDKEKGTGFSKQMYKSERKYERGQSHLKIV